ncbi:MAG: hypothetical protein Q8O33_11620 [Pseudomonadota bacterium]|nr:hypothetical protein [Pseudomonadota bacterium]
MPTIQIDDDVFAVLQSNAVAFVDSPNSTLRRLLGLDVSRDASSLPDSKVGSLADLDKFFEEHHFSTRRAKAPKADLKLLVQAGLLHEGELVQLVDYQGQRIASCEAAIAGAQLEFNGQRYSMSPLAQEQLRKLGFKSKSVRGPSHWVTVSGVSISALWEQLQAQIPK